jgi:hypothetical protein
VLVSADVAAGQIDVMPFIDPASGSGLTVIDLLA